MNRENAGKTTKYMQQQEELTMNQEWSLDPLYKGYDDPEFIRDMELVPSKIKEFRKVVATLGQGEVKDDLIACLKAQEQLEIDLLRRCRPLTGIAHCVIEGGQASRTPHPGQITRQSVWARQGSSLQ